LSGELLGSEKEDGLPRLCRFDAESDREVSLANARGADEKNVLGSGEELQCGEFTDELLDLPRLYRTRS
jgi:hypothetical protein